jgi:hypothetical protein
MNGIEIELDIKGRAMLFECDFDHEYIEGRENSFKLERCFVYLNRKMVEFKPHPDLRYELEKHFEEFHGERYAPEPDPDEKWDSRND